MQRKNSSPSPSPTRRNGVWFLIQLVLQCFFTVWLRYRARGFNKLPSSTGALLLINHQSFLDPLLVGLSLRRPVSYLARHNLFPVPIVGWILRRTYVMPINQDAPSASAIRECVRRAQHGFLVGIFPEGTRTETGELEDFKPGFITLLRRTNVPVYPVGIAGAFNAFPRGTCFIRPKRVRVVFGDPLDAEQLDRLTKRGNETDLIALVRKHILECHREADTWLRAATWLR